MKVCHVTAHLPDRASYRYRVTIPAGPLTALGWDVLEDEAPMADAINVYHKHRPAQLQNARSHGVDVFDVTDDHFSSERGPHYLEMCRRAKLVTTSSVGLANRIRESAGVDAVVIPDPYEFPERAHTWDGGNTCLWYGHGSNFDSLADVELDCHIEIVTGCQRPVGKTNCRLTPWSHAAMLTAFDRRDVVIIPVPDTPKARAKSPNRLVNALRQGKWVCAHPSPSHQEFSEFCWLGNILDGIRWAREHPDEVAAKVAAGQIYIRELYSPEVAAGAWDAALKRLHRVAAA